MASKTGLDVKGLAGSTAITGMLKALTVTKAGADWLGGDRKPYSDYFDGGSNDVYSNSQVVEWLAGGGRDISASPEDTKHSAGLLANEYVKAMNKVGRTVTNAKGKAVKITVERQTKAAITAGLRKSAKYIAGEMYKRVQSGTDNDGNRKPVTAKYAAWRNNKLHVNKSVVLVASKQLAEALQKGTIKIRFDSAGLGQAVAALK